MRSPLKRQSHPSRTVSLLYPRIRSFLLPYTKTDVPNASGPETQHPARISASKSSAGVTVASDILDGYSRRGKRKMALKVHCRATCACVPLAVQRSCFSYDFLQVGIHGLTGTTKRCSGASLACRVEFTGCTRRAQSSCHWSPSSGRRRLTSTKSRSEGTTLQALLNRDAG